MDKSLPPTPTGSADIRPWDRSQTENHATTAPTPLRVESRPEALEDEKLPATPQAPHDPERGIVSTEQTTALPRSPRTPAIQGPEWNASHPCYPHPNPHVPISSPLMNSTRVIRVPRNWMAAGDLYPAFSNVYPEILAPWIREVDFRRLVEGLNAQLAHTFDPTGLRAWIDGVMGCLTGWLWDDFGLTKSKSGMNEIERIIENWNRERKTESPGDDRELVHCIQLRRTGFLCLDIVIPDPKVMVVNEAQIKQSQNTSTIPSPTKQSEPKI